MHIRYTIGIFDDYINRNRKLDQRIDATTIKHITNYQVIYISMHFGILHRFDGFISNFKQNLVVVVVVVIRIFTIAEHTHTHVHKSLVQLNSCTCHTVFQVSFIISFVVSVDVVVAFDDLFCFVSFRFVYRQNLNPLTVFFVASYENTFKQKKNQFAMLYIALYERRRSGVCYICRCKCESFEFKIHKITNLVSSVERFYFSDGTWLIYARERETELYVNNGTLAEIDNFDLHSKIKFKKTKFSAFT